MKEQNAVSTFNTKLIDFEDLFKRVASDMIKLCCMAYELDQIDHTAFWQHCINHMKVSKSTVSVMIKSGKLYHEHEGLKEIPYTNVYELAPIEEQLDTYVDEIGGINQLQVMSQRQIRKSVKSYLQEADEAIGIPKQPEPVQLGFAETFNRERCIDIITELIEHWKQDKKMKLDKVDIENLSYIISELQKEV